MPHLVFQLCELATYSFAALLTNFAALAITKCSVYLLAIILMLLPLLLDFL